MQLRHRGCRAVASTNKNQQGVYQLGHMFLNQATTPDRYPLPNMQDLANHLHGATIFSKLDLVKGYHQVPVKEEDKAKTAIITPSTYLNIISCLLDCAKQARCSSA